MAAQHLLRLLHLASPALPIGGFHFSQGLEFAVEAGWVHDEASAREWIGGLARRSIGTLDLPILARLHAAWSAQDFTAIAHWDARLIAARESAELRAEDRHLGMALARILAELGVPVGIEPGKGPQSHAAAFARACVHYGIDVTETLQAYGWTWAENQVLAAIKLVPLGHTAGQRILDELIPVLTTATAVATALTDDEIGSCAVMQGLASARHESQYTRLFRS